MRRPRVSPGAWWLHLGFGNSTYFAKAAAELPFGGLRASRTPNLRRTGAALVAIIPVAMVFPILVTQMRLALVGLVAFVRPMTRFAAIGTGVLNGFVVAPFGVGDAAIAIVPIVGFCGGRTGGEEEAKGRSGQSRLSEKRTELKRDRFHKIASRSLARAGDRDAS